MSFSLLGAPSTFQKFTNIILKPLLIKGVLFYLDDIIVIDVMFVEHFRLPMEVFTLLHNSGLRLMLEKSKVMKKDIKYFGVKTSRSGDIFMKDFMYFEHFSELCELL